MQFIKDLVKKYRNFILYGVFGVIAAGLDYGICFLINHAGVSLELASIIGNVCGFFFTFSTNTFVNFKKYDRIVFRFISYILICLIGWGLSTLILHLFKDSVNNYILKVVAMAVSAVIQYFLNKFITYRK